MKRSRTIAGLIIVISVLALYWPVQNYDFIIIDDPLYVTHNGHVRNGFSLEEVKWAFTNTDVGFWYPLTWLSLLLDHHVYGMQAGGYHWTNILFHLTSALLLFIILNRMTGCAGRSFAAALIFAVHPLRVEPVAWVAERKDVLSVFLWMLTIWTYIRYAERPAKAAYGLVLFTFALANMAKSMVVTLPFILLLLDYWPLRRFWFEPSGIRLRPEVKETSSLILEKVPLIAISIVSGFLTYYAQGKLEAIHGTGNIWQQLNFVNPAVSYMLYIWKVIWPLDLGIYYPFRIWPLWAGILSWTALFGVSVLAVSWRRRYPYFLVGWFWFLVSMVPVIGFIHVGNQAIADRYTYLTTIGLIIIACWGVADLTKPLRVQRTFLWAASSVTVCALLCLTWHQVRLWETGQKLYEHTLRITEGNYFIHNVCGVNLMDKDPDRAFEHFRTATEIKPDYQNGYINMAEVLGSQGRLEEAARLLLKAKQMKPDSVGPYNTMGVVYEKMGRLEESISEFREAIRLKPSHHLPYMNLGNVLSRSGETAQAEKAYREAIRLRYPDLAGAHFALARVLADQGRKEEARAEIRELLRLDPHYPVSQIDLARIF